MASMTQQYKIACSFTFMITSEINVFETKDPSSLVRHFKWYLHKLKMLQFRYFGIRLEMVLVGAE